jgi:predicted Zn-dependent protease
MRPDHSTRVTVLVVLLCVLAPGLNGQTVVKLPKNKFTPQQDVALGREAAAEVRQQYPIIEDEGIRRYLSAIGDRLVAAAPPELNNPAYEYSFTPVNLKEINAFALPGGPMFVQRGMFDNAASEGEIVGVMAHELSHVLLRHGTANATKAQNPWLQLGQVAGMLGGAVVGGAAGSAIAQGSQFGLGTLLLRYSRDFEKQADLHAVTQNNPDLRSAGEQQWLKISQRTALRTPLVNPSPLGGQEHIGVYTTFLTDGSLFYLLTIVPESDANAYTEIFQPIAESVRLTETR